MTQPQIVLEINEVLKQCKVLKEHTIQFIDWMQSKGISIEYGDLKSMDKVIAGKRLAEWHREYREQHKNDPEPNPPSSDWNRQVDVDVKLDSQFLNEFAGLPMPEDMMQDYLAQMGKDRYTEIKSKVLLFMSEHRSCTLRELVQDTGENVVDMLVITLLLAQKGKLSVWQNKPYSEVFIAEAL